MDVSCAIYEMHALVATNRERAGGERRFEADVHLKKASEADFGGWQAS